MKTVPPVRLLRTSNHDTRNWLIVCLFRSASSFAAISLQIKFCVQIQLGFLRCCGNQWSNLLKFKFSMPLGIPEHRKFLGANPRGRIELRANKLITVHPKHCNRCGMICSYEKFSLLHCCFFPNCKPAGCPQKNPSTKLDKPQQAQFSKPFYRRERICFCLRGYFVELS